MSDNVMYPEAGRWVNSYLVGANAYKIMSTPEEAQQLLLDDSGDFLQTGTEHHYIQVRCRNEDKPLWLVPFRVKREELLRVSDVLEQIQMGRILREGFFWPFDLVRSDEMQGYVLHPFSMDAYPSVRRFLPSSDTPRWTIAVHLFRRIGQLHREGLTLNGFGRDQVRVEYGTNQVYLVPGETISRVSQIGAAFRGDFLSVPQVVEQQLEKDGIVLDGRVRDIFSAAVIAFYLLFYTHPFIGEEYSHLMREQYLEYFQSRPVFLFDAGGHNGTGHHQFGAEITAQWWRAQPELSRAEVNTVIGAVTKTTMLSASLVRGMVQQLLDAAQVKLSPVPRFLILANGRHGGACSVEDQREGEVLQAALASLETDTETALSDLQTLSQAGNAYASYQLGLYYSSHEMEGMDTQQVAQNFFNCAAQQGYGPGYGALADYALNGRRKNLRRAAQYFGYPTSLAGRDGKRWSKNAADLLAYREQNVRSGRQTLLLVVVTLVITLLAGICSPREFAMAVPALVLELGCGVRCVLGLVMDPYGSYRFVYAALAACWLLNILCLV